MSIRIATVAFLMSFGPAQVSAQDAFIPQISVGSVSAGVSVGIALPAVQTPSTAGILSSLTASLPTIEPQQFFGSIDLSAYPLVAAAVDGPVAEVTSIGNDNNAEIVQTGLQAASIYQNGSSNWASIYQAGGTNNRASIYQASSNSTALVSQSGSNNRALVVQN